MINHDLPLLGLYSYQTNYFLVSYHYHINYSIGMQYYFCHYFDIERSRNFNWSMLQEDDRGAIGGGGEGADDDGDNAVDDDDAPIPTCS